MNAKEFISDCARHDPGFRPPPKQVIPRIAELMEAYARHRLEELVKSIESRDLEKLKTTLIGQGIPQDVAYDLTMGAGTMRREVINLIQDQIK